MIRQIPSIAALLFLSIVVVLSTAATSPTFAQTTVYAPCNDILQGVAVEYVRLNNTEPSCSFSLRHVVAATRIQLLDSSSNPPRSIAFDNVTADSVYIAFGSAFIGPASMSFDQITVHSLYLDFRFVAAATTSQITISVRNSLLVRPASSAAHPSALTIYGSNVSLIWLDIEVSRCTVRDLRMTQDGLLEPSMHVLSVPHVRKLLIVDSVFSSIAASPLVIQGLASDGDGTINVTGNTFVFEQHRTAPTTTKALQAVSIAALWDVRHFRCFIFDKNTVTGTAREETNRVHLGAFVNVKVVKITNNYISFQNTVEPVDDGAGSRAIYLMDFNNTSQLLIENNKLSLRGANIGTVISVHRHITLPGYEPRGNITIRQNHVVVVSGAAPQGVVAIAVSLALEDLGLVRSANRQSARMDHIFVENNSLDVTAHHAASPAAPLTCDLAKAKEFLVSVFAVMISGAVDVVAFRIVGNQARMDVRVASDRVAISIGGMSTMLTEKVADVGRFVFTANVLTVMGIVVRVIGYGVPSPASRVGQVIVINNTLIDTSIKQLFAGALSDNRDAACMLLRSVLPESSLARGTAFAMVHFSLINDFIVEDNQLEQFAEPAYLTVSGFLLYHEFAADDRNDGPAPIYTSSSPPFLRVRNNKYTVKQLPSNAPNQYQGIDANKPLCAPTALIIYGPTKTRRRAGGTVLVDGNTVNNEAGSTSLLFSVAPSQSGVTLAIENNKLQATVVRGATDYVVTMKARPLNIVGIVSTEAQILWSATPLRVTLSLVKLADAEIGATSAFDLSQSSQFVLRGNQMSVLVSSSASTPVSCMAVNSSMTGSIEFSSVDNNNLDFSQCTDSVLIAGDFGSTLLSGPGPINFTAAATSNTMRCNGDLSKGRCAFSSLILKQSQSQSSSVQVANLDLSLRSNTITTSSTSKPVNTGQLAQFYFARQQQGQVQQPFGSTSRLSLGADGTTTGAAPCNTIVSSSDNKQYSGLFSKSQRQLAAMVPAAGGFELDPQCMIRTLTKSAPLTLSRSLSIQPPVPRPPPSTITTSTNNAAQAVAMSMFAMSAAVVPGLSFGVARQQAVVRFAERAKTGNCAGLGDEQEQELQVQLADSPMQLRVGSVAPKIFGAVIGNVVLVALFVSVTFLIVFGYVRATTGTSSSNNKAPSPPPPTAAEIFAKFHIALVLYLLVSFLHAPTLSFGLVLVAAPDPVPTGTRVAALLLALLLSFVAVGYSVWALFLRRPCIDVFKRNKSPQDEFDADPTKDSMSARNVVKRLRLYLLGRSGEWWAKREKQNATTGAPAASSTAAKAKSDAETVIKFQAALPFFDAYNSRAQWFVFVEFATQIGLAISSMLAQIVVSDDGKASCMAQGVTLVIVLIAYLAAALILRPFVKRLPFIAVVAMSVPQIVAVGLALAESQEEAKRDKNSESSGGVLGAVAAALAMEFIVSGMVVLGAVGPFAALVHRFVSSIRRMETQGRGIGAAREWARGDIRNRSNNHKNAGRHHDEKRERRGDHDDRREALLRNFNEEFHRRHHSSSRERDRERERHHRDERDSDSHRRQRYAPPATSSSSPPRHRAYSEERSHQRHNDHHHDERHDQQHYSSNRNSSRRFDDDYDDRDEIELQPMRRSTPRYHNNSSNHSTSHRSFNYEDDRGRRATTMNNTPQQQQQYLHTSMSNKRTNEKR